MKIKSLELEYNFADYSPGTWRITFRGKMLKDGKHQLVQVDVSFKKPSKDWKSWILGDFTLDSNPETIVDTIEKHFINKFGLREFNRVDCINYISLVQ